MILTRTWTSAKAVELKKRHSAIGEMKKGNNLFKTAIIPPFPGLQRAK